MFKRICFVIFSILLLSTPSSFGGDTPIHTAAEEGNLGKVRRLVKSGVDINLKDQERKTPLQRAYENKHRWLAQWLVDHGAQIFAKDYKPLRKLKVRTKTFNDPPKKKKKGSVYDDIARATGGAVYQFDKGKMDGMADIMTAQLGATTLLNREIEFAGTKRVAFKLEAGWASAMFSVTAIGRKPTVRVQNPSGIPVNGDGGNKIIPLKNGSVTIVEYPAPGTWVVVAKGKGNLHVKVEAKKSRSPSRRSKRAGSGKAEFYKFEFVDLAGRPGHQGLFPSKLPLVPGEERVVRAVVFGELTDLRLFLLKRNGNPVAGTGRGFQPDMTEGDESLYKIRVPGEAFRIKIEGIDAEGSPVSLMYRPVFNPDLDLAVFNFKPKGELGVKDCVLAQSFMQVMQSDAARASARITCEIGTSRPRELSFGMKFYIPPPGGGPEKVVFFPDPRYKYNEKQCGEMKNFMDKFSSKTRVRKTRASWQSQCATFNDKSRFEIHVRVYRE